MDGERNPNPNSNPSPDANRNWGLIVLAESLTVDGESNLYPNLYPNLCPTFIPTLTLTLTLTLTPTHYGGWRIQFGNRREFKPGVSTQIASEITNSSLLEF